MMISGIRKTIAWIIIWLLTVLCVASVVVWVRSYHVHDKLYLDYPIAEDPDFPDRILARGWTLTSWRGGVYLSTSKGSVPLEDSRFGLSHRTNPLYLKANVPGHTRLYVRLPKDEFESFQLRAGWWMVSVVLGLWPAIFFTRLIVRRWRRKDGVFCATCGYDLRATPERCPECGTIAQPHK